MSTAVRIVLVCLLMAACVSEPGGPGPAGPPDVPVYGGDRADGVDEPALEEPSDHEPMPPASLFEVAFIDRDGPIVADPADPYIPVGENFLMMVRSDDGSTRRATEARMALQNVRFVTPADPADFGPGDGNAVVYDALAGLDCGGFIGDGRFETGSVTLTDLDPALDSSPTPLLELAPPDNVDVDPISGRAIACGPNYSPCICCGMRTRANILSLTGGADQALEDSLNDALAMELMTGAMECQFAMDGTVIYATGMNMDGDPVLVRAMLGAGAVMAEPVPEAGSQGIGSFDISPDGMKIAFVNPLGSGAVDGGGVTVRDLSGEMMPFTLSEPAVDQGDRSEEWAAQRVNRSPRWCDDSHVVWQTIDGTRRTIWLGDTMTHERVDLWSDENRIPLTEAWIDCRVRQE
jgi:hypothetical protein